MDYFGDGSKISHVTGKTFGVKIEYFVEDKPLGNAGALFKIKDKLDSDFLLLNADAVFDVDFNRFVSYHKMHNALVTLFTHPNSHPYDSGLIVSNKYGVVEQWLAKEEVRLKFYRNRVNAGLHVINPIVLEQTGILAYTVGKYDENGSIIKVDLDRQLLKPFAGTGQMYCYDSPEYVKDMGTPERYYGLYIAHGCPIFVNPTAAIGNNVNLSQFTTIGSNHNQAAVIGDYTYIGLNVCIVEDVIIGKNVTIGAGSVVTKNIPDNDTACGNYAKVINYNNPGRYTNNNRWTDFS